MLSILLIMLFQVLKTPDSLGQPATFLAEVVKVGILNHHLLIRSRHITVPYESYRKQTQLAFFKTLWLLRRRSFGRSDWRPRWRPVDQLEEPCHCHKHYRLKMTTMTWHDLENGKNHITTEEPRHCHKHHRWPSIRTLRVKLLERRWS